jgi:hypothetical protein
LDSKPEIAGEGNKTCNRTGIPAVFTPEQPIRLINMNKKIALLLAGFATTSWSVLAAEPDLSKLPPASKQSGVTYAKDIHPMLEASCLRCHGNDKPKAGLNLGNLAAVLKGGKEGKVVEPGKSEKSLLVIAAAQIDPETAMPPKPKQRGPRGGGPRPGDSSTNAPGGPKPPQGGGPGVEGGHGLQGGPSGSGPGGGRGGFGPPPKPLTAEQVGLLRAWIDQGAK